MSLLEVNILGKTFPAKGKEEKLCVIENMSFTMSAGEFCCLVGPSGCGKTTLLNLISGIDLEFEGKILSGGLPATETLPSGYMFQSARLMPWLSVGENINLVMPEYSPQKISNLLEEMDLGGFANAYPNTLSGGMRRRVALARAIINEPKLILLDEPFLSLDVTVANRLRRLLLEVCSRRSSTVLFVTHDLREAIYLADKILFLSSRPSRVVKEQKISLKKPRNPDDKTIEKMFTKLAKVMSGYSSHNLKN